VETLCIAAGSHNNQADVKNSLMAYLHMLNIFTGVDKKQIFTRQPDGRF
jgi:hypothetical protein